MSGGAREALLSATAVVAGEGPDPDVAELLRLGRGGAPTACPANLDVIFGQDPRWAGALRFNEFDERVYNGDHSLGDTEIGQARLWLSQVYAVTAGERAVESAIVLVARRRPYHPLREAIRSARWDGLPRMDRLLPAYAGADDTPLNRALGRRFLIAAVARAMRPGCKQDCMLVLYGRQGTMKSTFVAALAMQADFFSDTTLDLNSKDAQENILGKWILEWQECHSLASAPATRVKAFLSSATDHFRLPYGRRSSRYPRSCVFVGTTNHEQFVEDQTGSRRFWPVATGGVRVADLRRDCLQLWAEALVAYEAGEQWHLTSREEAWLDRESARYRHEDAWRPILRRWAEGRPPFHIAEAAEAVGVPVGRVDKRVQARLASCLRAEGLERYQGQVDGVKAWRWARPAGNRPRPEEAEDDENCVPS